MVFAKLALQMAKYSTRKLKSKFISFVFDENLLSKLERALQHIGWQIGSIDMKLSDGQTIECQTVAELLNTPPHLWSSVEEIVLSIQKPSDSDERSRSLASGSLWFRRAQAMTDPFMYSLSGQDASVMEAEKHVLMFAKRVRQWYTPLSRMFLWNASVYLVAASYIILERVPSTARFFRANWMLVLVVSLQVFLFLMQFWGRRKIFPSAIFKIGEGHAEFETAASGRRWLWSVLALLGTTILGVIIGRLIGGK